MGNSVPLSVAIITKNAESKLAACLGSLSFADEIVIVDSGSTDGTEAIARQFGAKWYVEPWKGYGPQRNSCLAKCANDWVLAIDADERVPEQTARTISDVLHRADHADAYAFPRKNFFHGKWIRYGDWWPDYCIRMMRRSRGRFERLTHESWATDGRIEKLACPIEHFSYDSYADMFRMLNTYSTQLAEQLYADGKTAGPGDALLRAFWMFFRNYFIRLAIVGGFDGFMISLTKALGTFLKYAKLYELKRSVGAGLSGPS